MKNQPKTTYSIVSVQKNDAKQKASLIKSLAKKRNHLMMLTAKVEMLRMDLDIIKREYDVRIGKLYLKDDQLDLEIIRYNRIKTLLNAGKSFQEAVKEINDIYEQEKDIFDMKFDEIAQEEQTAAKRKKIPDEEEQDIKKLWKKLLFQLHPDLTADKDEKKQRENVMRKINIAYTENDYETLKSIEQQHYIEDPEISTVASLEKILESIENAIIYKEIEYKNLLESEWCMWKRKSDYAKKRNTDLFKELEEKLLDDIARKIKIVHVLRDEFDALGYY